MQDVLATPLQSTCLSYSSVAAHPIMPCQSRKGKGIKLCYFFPLQCQETTEVKGVLVLVLPIVLVKGVVLPNIQFSPLKATRFCACSNLVSYFQINQRQKEWRQVKSHCPVMQDTPLENQLCLICQYLPWGAHPLPALLSASATWQ